MSGMIQVECAHCGAMFDARLAEIKYRADRGICKNFYCGRTCSGLARRTGKSAEQKVEEKRVYDSQYRKTSPSLKQRKSDYYKRTADRDKEREHRAKNMPRHLEYCRRPEYRAKKREYDFDYRSREFGEFAEAYKLSVLINREVKSRATNHEIYQTNNKSSAQKRKRQLA